MWTVDYDDVIDNSVINTTFKWDRSTLIDHQNGDIYIQFSRQTGGRSHVGPTGTRGSIFKYDKETGDLKVVFGNSVAHENRWVPYVLGDFVYTVYSNYFLFQDGSPDLGRVGNWVYKLDRETLEIVDQREVSCDFGMFESFEGFSLCAQVQDFSNPEEIDTYLSFIQGTGQLNGILAAGPLLDGEEDRCGPGAERLLLTISGFPYATTLSNEPQLRTLGQHNIHHYGKALAICSDSLLPAWRDPYRNAFAVPNEFYTEQQWKQRGGITQKRDLLVGDAVTEDYIKEGNDRVGVLIAMDCDNMPLGTKQYLPQDWEVTVISSESSNAARAAAHAQLEIGDVLTVHNPTAGSPEFEIINKTVNMSNVTLHLDPYRARYGEWNKGSTLFLDKGPGFTYTVHNVIQLNMVTCYTKSSSLEGFKYFNDIDCFDWTIPVKDGELSDDQVIVAPNIPDVMPVTRVCDFNATIDHALGVLQQPSLKQFRRAGDNVSDDEMRISLGNFGGSFWVRASQDGEIACTVSGNGAGESLDKYEVTIDILLAMKTNDVRVADAIQAFIAEDSPANLAELEAALAEREKITKDKDQFRQELSPADVVNANSAMHCFKLRDGSPFTITEVTGPDTWLLETALLSIAPGGHFGLIPEAIEVADALGQYSYVDAETNNVVMIPGCDGRAERLVGTSKGGTVFTIDAKTGVLLDLTPIGQQSVSAQGRFAVANFGGICYPGDGDIVAVHTSFEQAPFIFTFDDPEKEPIVAERGTAATVGYNFRTFKVEWVYLRSKGFEPGSLADSAVGAYCGRGLVFSMDVGRGEVVAIQVSNGREVFTMPAPSCTALAYNCLSIMVSDDCIYVSTETNLTKYEIGYTRTFPVLHNPM